MAILRAARDTPEQPAKTWSGPPLLEGDGMMRKFLLTTLFCVAGGFAQMPKQFNLDVRVPSGGATGPIFRQCNKPQTTLLLVAKNWDKLGAGAD